MPLWSLYEIIHICTAVVDKSEEWSSQWIFQFNNWKEEAWKNEGFNGIRTRDLRNTGAMLYQLSYEATHLLWWSVFTFIYNRFTIQIWIISYKLHIISLHEKIFASLPMCVFIAQLVEHRTGIGEVTRSNPVEAPRPRGIAALQSWLVPAASTRICSSTCYMWEASLLPLARMFSSSKKTVRPNALERSAEGFWTSSSRPAYGQTLGSRPSESERWSVIRHLRCRQPKSA